MPNRPSTLRLLAGLTLCGVMAQASHAAVAVSVDFLLSTIRFAPADPEGYFLFPSLQATGFVDDANLNNYVKIQSNDLEFGGDMYPARGVGSGTLGSIVSADVPELVSRINTGTGWTLTVIDGTTNQTRTYAITITTPGIDSAYIRPMTLGVVPNTTMSTAPSFVWTEPPATEPNSAWTTAFGGLYASDWHNNVFTPAFGPSDLAWTPDAPLNPDTYTLGISKVNENPPQSLLTVSTPVPQGGAPALASFTKHIRAQSDANAEGLNVPCGGGAGTVSISFDPGIIGFSSIDPPVYILGMSIDASGFVDEFHDDNYVRIESENDHFSADLYPARGVGSGTAGSIGLPSAAALEADINNEGDWTLTITDGTTGQTRLFTLDVTTPGFGTDYLRPITLDVQTGDTISSTQTFTWSQDSTANPLAQNTSAFGGLFGNNATNNQFSPGFGTNDTAWTPALPMQPDTYLFLVAKVNDAPDQSLVVATTPVPNTPGACSLENFTQSVRIQVSAQIGDLHVLGSACDSIDFNNDSLFPDTADIDDFLSVFSGGPCSNEPNCGDIDFNNDTLFPDTLDIDSLLSVFSGGACL